MPLTQDQEDFTHKLDALGLGMIGAGVAGHALGHGFAPKVNASWAAENLPKGWQHLQTGGLPQEAFHAQAGWRNALHGLGEKLTAAGPALDLAGLGLIAPQTMGYLAKKKFPDANGDGVPDAPAPAAAQDTPQAPGTPPAQKLAYSVPAAWLVPTTVGCRDYYGGAYARLGAIRAHQALGLASKGR